MQFIALAYVAVAALGLPTAAAPAPESTPEGETVARSGPGTLFVGILTSSSSQCSMRCQISAMLKHHAAIQTSQPGGRCHLLLQPEAKEEFHSATPMPAFRRSGRCNVEICRRCCSCSAFGADSCEKTRNDPQCSQWSLNFLERQCVDTVVLFWGQQVDPPCGCVQYLGFCFE